MKGELAEQRLFFKLPAWYDDNRVTTILESRATSIDRASRKIDIDGGTAVSYDALVLATGGTVDAINSPQEFLFSRKLISQGQSVARQLLADSAITMKEIVNSGQTSQ